MNTTTNFIISGISDQPLLQFLLFLLVLITYLITIGGNMTIFLLVCLDHYLHTPMYFFLANLAILDISCSTIILYKILISFITGDKTVSVPECLLQIYIFLGFTCDELLILTAMSYDRYVAICNPLHYHRIMNCTHCVLLAFSFWFCAFIQSLLTFIGILKITCYKSNKIDHFFCDVVPIVKLSCSDTTFLQLYILIGGGFLSAFTPFALTSISYTFIIASILSIRTSSGRRKAFYTCSSHLTVVILLYASLFFQYLRPTSSINLGSSKYFSLFNAAAVPVLNPLIYSLKNKDVKAAIRRKMKLAGVSVNAEGHGVKM